MLEPFHQKFSEQKLAIGSQEETWTENENFESALLIQAIKRKVNMNSNANRPWPSIRPPGTGSDLGFNPPSWDFMSLNFLESNKKNMNSNTPLRTFYLA